MHYYQKNIGDYAKKTGHLTALEHGVYHLIIDGYYDREHGPTLIEATRWARARTEDENRAVLAILGEFFTLGSDGRYTQSRVEEELGRYHERAETNRVIAVERERRKRERTEQDRQRTEHEQSTNRAPIVHHDDQDREPNHKPITNNQEPLKSTTPIPPEGGKASSRKAAVSFKTFMAECKLTGETPIPEDSAVFEYAKQSGIPRDFLRLQWHEFKDRYSLPDAKKYKSWPTVFCKSVRGNWFKLWFADRNTGTYTLTTTGFQAQNTHKEAA